MDLVAVTDIDAAFAQLQERLMREAEGIDVRLVTPEGAGPARALWYEREGIWAILEPDDERSMYWCSLGTSKPAPGGDVYYICMANLSRNRTPWNTAGALAADPKTHELYYLHSGRFGKPTQTQQFAEHYHGVKANVTWPNGRIDSRYVIGQLRDKEFISRLAAFVKAAEGVKTGGTLESYYRNAIINGVEVAIEQARQQLGSNQRPTAGDSVSRTRLTRLENLHKWLRDDPEMLQTAVDIIVGKTEQDRRRHLILSVGAAASSIIIGWLLSAIQPDTILSYALHVVH